MALLDKTTVRVAVTLLVIAVVLGFAWMARKPLIAFLFAVLFAYLLEPLILRVQMMTKRSRGFSIAVVYVGLLIALTIFGLLIGPKLATEGRRLANTAPDLYQKVTSGDIAWQVGQQRGWSFQTMQRVKGFLAGHREQFSHAISSQQQRIGALAANMLWFLIVPILAVFFLKDKSRFSTALQHMVESRKNRALLRGVLNDMDVMLAHYVRAQLYLAIISGVVYTIALTVMRVPYALVLGAIGGSLEFVPVLGPATAAVIILGVSFMTNYPHLLFVAIFLGVWRVIQDYVIAPRILGERVELHPLAALFGILAGAEIGGVIGVYLAIPLMAAVRILWHRWQMMESGRQVEVLPEREAA